jgi:hypothetical protein
MYVRATRGRNRYSAGNGNTPLFSVPRPVANKPGWPPERVYLLAIAHTPDLEILASENEGAFLRSALWHRA